MTATSTVAEQVDRLTIRLVDEYADRVPDRVVRGLVAEAYGPMASARVTQFVPVLVDREVRSRLRAQHV